MPLLNGGITIPSLPAGGYVNLRLGANVTGAVGSNVSLSATVTAPAGVTDPNPGNKSHSQTQTVAAASGTP